MKKHFIYLTAAALASGLAACSNDELEGTSSFAQGGFTLTASIENAEIPSTRVGINESAKFSWIQGDAIGLFDGGGVKENGSQKAYKFDIKDSGKFGKADGVKVPSTFNPDYAVYPYDFVDENDVDLTLGEFLLELPGTTLVEAEADEENGTTYTWGGTIDGAIDWTAAVVKMPMAGTVTANTTAHTFSTAFKNLTALMKLTVKNIPANYDLAVLEAKGNNGIAGSATVTFDADDKPSLALNGDKVLKAIVYKISDDDANVEGSTKTFYFPIPAGAYSQGLHFFLDNSTKSAPIEIQTKALNAKQNWLYASSFSLNGDGKVQAEETTRVNNSLAKKTLSEVIDLSAIAEDGETQSVIYLPKAYATTNVETVTLTLKNCSNAVANSDNTYKSITIMEDPVGTAGNVAAKNLIIKTDATATTNVPEITVVLPNSNVTLGDGDVAEPTAQAFGGVAATVGSYNAKGEPETSNNVTVSSKVLLTSLAVSGGDIFVNDGALTSSGSSSTFTSGDSKGHCLYAVTSSDVSSATITSPLVSAPMFVYKLKTTQGNETIDIEKAENFTLPEPITILNAQNLVINLNNNTLTSSEGVLILDKSSVTIKDEATDVDKPAGKLWANTTTGGTYAVVLKNGSTLTLNSGTIESKKNALSATGEGTTFTMNGGTLAANSNGNIDAIKLAEKASADVEAGEIAKGRVNLNSGSSATIKVALPNAAVLVNSSKLTYNNADAVLAGAITISGESSETSSITAKSITGAITNAGNLTLNVSGSVSNITNSGTLNQSTAASAGNITNSGTLNLTTTGAVGAVTTSGTGKATISAASAGEVTSASDLDLTTTTGNIGTVSVTAGTTNIDAKGEKATVGNLTINGDNTVLNLNGGAAGTVTASNGTFKMVDGTSTGAITQTKGTVNIEGGKVTATESTVALTVADKATIGTADGTTVPVITSASAAAITVAKDAVLTINKGTITSTGADAITNASDNAATININGGTIEAKTAEKSALTIASATTVTVTGGEITGAKSAIDLSAGTLIVPSGDPKFTGENVIAATGSGVSISLAAADAKYVTTTSANAVSDKTTDGAIKSISGGWFSGDITSQKSEYFITGGHFQKCNNLESSDGSKYFMTFYKLSGSTNGYWNVENTAEK